MTWAKRALALLLSLVIVISSLFTLTSCDRSYNEEEVIAVAGELLPTARMLYSVYYGNGISYISSGYSDGDYREADSVHLASLGFESVEQLKNISYSTFSNKYCDNIFSNYLESFEADGKVYNYARYVQVYDVNDQSKPAYILVYYKHKPVFEDKMTYNMSSIRALRSKGDYVIMSVDVTVENEEGKTQTSTIEFSLFEEKTGWRIASPAFANYNNYLDHELLK